MAERFFRSVGASVATEPKLKGVLNDEKDVADGFRGLAKRTSTASKQMAEWGNREGDDLGVILSNLDQINQKQAQLLAAYADKYEEFRTHLKGMYAREQAMSEHRKKRPELNNKLQSHIKAGKPDVDAIRKEIEMFERDLSQLEADHMTYKRASVHSALAAQYDALIEFAGRLQILAVFGKYLADQVPLDRIPPGISRPPFANGPVCNTIVNDCNQAYESWKNPIGGSDNVLRLNTAIPSPIATAPGTPLPEGASSPITTSTPTVAGAGTWQAVETAEGTYYFNSVTGQTTEIGQPKPE